jgi:hypothetical protein
VIVSRQLVNPCAYFLLIAVRPLPLLSYFINMADSPIGRRFDFVLKDETRLEGTLASVNQETRQLTITAGAVHFV